MKLLKEAIRIQQERESSYGDFPTAMRRTARIFNELSGGTKLESKDVAMLYLINKLVREREEHNDDNIVDAIAYLAVMGELDDSKKKK